LYKPHGPIFEGSTILTSAFQYAMDIDDLNFFARVGDVLRKRQEKLGALFEPLTKPPVLHQFLLKHWAQGHNGIPPLCNLSVEELTEVCRTRLRNKSLTHDAVAKTKQRLGLISTRSIPAK
jgi:hypothetical protein